MGERYFITGAQLGALITYLKMDGAQMGVELIDKIIDEQHIGDAKEFNEKFDWKEHQVAP